MEYRALPSGATERTLMTAFGITGASLLVVLLAGVYQFWLVQGSIAKQGVLATEALSYRDRFLRLVNEETGVRGYVATSDSRFLDIYYSSLRSEDAAPADASIVVVQRYLRDQVLLVRRGHADAARRNLPYGKALMDRTRRVEARVEEAALTELRRQRLHTVFLARAGLAAGLLLCALVVVSGAGSVWLWRHALHHRRRSERDPLTGVLNRDAMMSIIERLVASSPKTPFGVIFFDLDGFKKINDVHGHAAGDAILRKVAERIKGELRESDAIARFGGDEFVCVIAPPCSNEQLQTIADRLRKAARRPYQVGDDAFVVGCSVGVSRYPQHGDVASALLSRADQAMYAEKHSSRATQRFELSNG